MRIHKKMCIFRQLSSFDVDPHSMRIVIWCGSTFKEVFQKSLVSFAGLHGSLKSCSLSIETKTGQLTERSVQLEEFCYAEKQSHNSGGAGEVNDASQLPPSAPTGGRFPAAAAAASSVHVSNVVQYRMESNVIILVTNHKSTVKASFTSCVTRSLSRLENGKILRRKSTPTTDLRAANTKKMIF